MLMQIDKIGSLHFLAEFAGEARKNKSGHNLLANVIYFSRVLEDISK